MNVVYASNDNFARHLATSLCSLLDHNQLMKELNIYVMSVNMSNLCKDQLRKIAEQFDRPMEIIELGNLEARFTYRVNTGGFDVSTLSRLFVSEVLPESVERILYLDCDTVILRSLQKLWDLDLRGKILAAVMEPTIYESVKEEIGLGEQDPYFNAGVLLIDLKKWREQDIQTRILDFYQAHDGFLFACDQDTINGALKGEIRPMSPSYNFFTNYRYFKYEELVRQSSSYQMVPKEIFQRAKHHPAIVHYMGDERPWIAGNMNHYRKAYEFYLDQTPWRGAPKESKKRIYMFAYHVMDYLTFLWPASRRLISQKLGMKARDRKSKKS